MSLFRRHHHDSDSDEDTDAGGPNDESRIDPDLRLRTVRTAHSTLAESIRNEVRAQRRKERKKSILKPRGGGGGTFKLSLRRRPKGDNDTITERSVSMASTSPLASSTMDEKKKVDPEKERAANRRTVFVNGHLPDDLLDSNGEPIVRYVRNKVRTTKYTPLTFVPKNLYEQFRRIANLYFLVVVIIQLFPVFGAAAPTISWIPLAFILTVTMIKDGIEDFRRGRVDEQVNRAECIRLTGASGWKNVNHPNDGRGWWEKLWGMNQPGKVTKGVKKLREKRSLSTFSLGGASGMGMGDDLERMSVDTHSYPPNSIRTNSKSTTTLVNSRGGVGEQPSSMSMSMSRPSISAPSPINRNTLDLDPSLWELTLWKKLVVGDILYLPENSSIPADCIVLATSSPDDDGICYVETKNLDGETNLKPRMAIKSSFGIEDVRDGRWKCILDSEGNTANLYAYNAVLHVGEGERKKTEPIQASNLLLRGCTLRNTKWVIALVAFTGPDTKIMLNGGETPSKRSKIEKETQFNVIVNFVLLFLMCVVTAIVSGLFEGKKGTSADVFEVGAEPTKSIALNSIITFCSCLIAFQNIIPISLYISIEIVKTIQAYFINQDVDMYYDELGTSCVPKTWNISDDLGQIEYVFSDKTGTLTRNVMEFKRISVHGKTYGEGGTEAERGAQLRAGGRGPTEHDLEEEKEHLERTKERMIALMREGWNNRWLVEEKVTLLSEELALDLSPSTAQDAEQKTRLTTFWRALALCHSVLADKTTTPGRVEYKAESPDEAALVAGARDLGFVFVGKTNTQFTLEVLGRTEVWEPLKVLEFNSTRKRMSVIVREPKEFGGRIMLITKGADSVIFERLRADHPAQLKADTHRDLEKFANAGLRTLLVASRMMSEQEYHSFEAEYDAAAAITGEGRDERLDECMEKVEVGLEILGATALEDKLQEGVPQAIEMLHKAGIRCWILTGDKVQTAIEIGYSCNLLKPEMEIMVLQAETPERARALIEAGLNKIMSVQGPPSPQRGFVARKGGFAVVIDGQTLRFALDEKNGGLRGMFLSLGCQCETVVCCRVSPAQKAQTVKLVKDGQKALTLAIGDGANDVAMIQEANVGCGLFGHEGSQAAMSADYAFGQFRFLTKLLLVHGRWSYTRIADMHGNFFYKNVVWTFAMFWFLFYNSFDATYLYEYTFILLYNLVFTSLPVIVMGAFDQDVNAKAGLAFPQLYIRGIRGLEYTKPLFWSFMLDGFYQSAVVFFIPFLAWQVNIGGSHSWTGRGIDSLADFGTVVSVCAIFCANQYVGMNTRYWTVITWIVVFGSTLVMMLWITVYSFFTSIDFDLEIIVLFGSMNFWATLFVTAVIALGPRFLYKVICQMYWPQDRDIVREMWVVGDLKDQLGLEHRNKKKAARIGAASGFGGPGGAPLEAASMVQNPHARSMSELSSSYGDAAPGSGGSPRGQYVPTGTDTPQSGTPRPFAARHLDSPGYELDHTTPQPREENVQPAELFVPTQQDTSRLSPHTPPHPYTRSPLSTPRSPVLSYYSATDIPSPGPSPIPPPPGSGTPTTATPKFSPTNPYFAVHQQQAASSRPPPTAFKDPTQGQQFELKSMRSQSEISHYSTADEGDETSTEGSHTIQDPHTLHHQLQPSAHERAPSGSTARPSFDSNYSGPVAF